VGDSAEAVERLYAAHKHAVFRLALRYGAGDRAFAEDVTHDVFVRLLRAFHRLDHDEDLGGWLYRVTTNRCLSRLRTEQVRRSVLGLLGLDPRREAPGLAERVEARDALTRTLAAVERLPPKERVAFGMKFLDGKSQNEIADTMGHSKGYVSKLLSRATERLRAEGWEVNDD